MTLEAMVHFIFVAAPRDVETEAQRVVSTILSLNNLLLPGIPKALLPLRGATNTLPQTGSHPQAIINNQTLSRADFLIAVFGDRLGTPTEDAASGTASEVRVFTEGSSNAMLFFRKSPRPDTDVTGAEYKRLKEYEFTWKPDAYLSWYESLDDLVLQVNNGLIKWVLGLSAPPAMEKETEVVVTPGGKRYGVYNRQGLWVIRDPETGTESAATQPPSRIPPGLHPAAGQTAAFIGGEDVYNPITDTWSRKFM